MPYCPNPECPHLLRTGKPADFVEGVTNCSDCNTPLSSYATSDAPIIEQKKEHVPSDFRGRILFTIGMIILYRISVHIPTPGFDIEAFAEFMERRAGYLIGNGIPFPPLSILALGIMPYMSTYMIVEILALFAPPLKTWRNDGYRGRAKLKITALVGTVFMALIQGYGIARGMETMGGYPLVVEPGMGFRSITAFTLTAGAFVAIWITEMITKKGIGHGISVLIISGIISRIVPFYMPKLSKYYHETSPVCFLLMSGCIITLLGTVFIIEKSYRSVKILFKDNKETTLPLKITTAGTVPTMWASSIIMMPASFASFISIPWVQSMANHLSPGSITYEIMYAIMLFFFYYFFTAIFYNPSKIVPYLKKRDAIVMTPNGQETTSYLDRTIGSLALLGFVYLYVLVTVPKIILKISSISIFIGGVLFIKAVAIILDIKGEFKARNAEGNLIKIEETHDIPQAGFIKSILETNGINCYLRGYYHRALLYFFGPYIEVSVLVPEEKSDEANEVLNKYIRREDM